MTQTPNQRVQCGSVCFANDETFTLISGPCQMESRDHAMMLAEKLKAIADKHGVDYVFKASFDKANRTSLKGQRGIGLEKAIPVFEEIRRTFNIPVLTDVHTSEQCAVLDGVVDILQIPAFLCRQTDLLVAAARTNCVINIKKGQFLAPWDMQNVLDKVTMSGNPNVLLTDRGTSFGYNTLVSDFRGLPIMAAMGAPVIFDATHSVQQPGGQGRASGGEQEFVSVLARAAIAVGVAGLFMECHEEPARAPSDGPVMVPLEKMVSLIEGLKALDDAFKQVQSTF